MQNPRLASRYAKSLIDLAKEQNSLDAVLKDIELLKGVCQSNPDFVLMLKSPVVKGDKKIALIKLLFEGKIGAVTLGFVELMIKKGREFYLPEIVNAYVAQDNEIRNVKTVHLTTATAIDAQLTNLIESKVAASVKDGGTIALKTSVDESLIGGFILEIGDKFFDASVRRDLNDIKKQFTKNLYIADI